MESPYFKKEEGFFGNIKEFIKNRNSTIKNFFLIKYDIDLEDFKYWDKDDYNWNGFLETIYFKIKNEEKKQKEKEGKKEEEGEIDEEINGS